MQSVRSLSLSSHSGHISASAMTNAASSYQYQPVNSIIGEIRLLTIRAGSSTDPLGLTLESCHQISKDALANTSDTETAPTRTKPGRPFEALSYAWGSTTDLVDIRIDGSNHGLLSVTRNLSAALPYLRLADKDRVIWIDAICINQLDLVERALQVQLIAGIFRQATRVICWMGIESADSDLAILTIRKLSSKVDVDLQKQTIRPTSGKEARWADFSKPFPFDAQIMHALSNFFGRPYFSRLWVFQEIRQAGDRAVLQCGSSTFQRQDLLVANWCFMHKPWKEPMSNEFKRRIELVRQMFYTNTTNLGLLIRRTANLNCSDPRDRVYALMGLRWKEERELPIEADYTKPPGKVYQDYVHQFIVHFKSLRLLSFCEIQDHSSDMPSWVPDWSRLPHTNAPRALQLAAGQMPSDVISISEKVLAVTGVHVATTQEAHPIEITSGSDDDAIKVMRKHAPSELFVYSHPEDTTLLEAYCCTLCVDTFSHRTIPHKIQFPSFSESLEALKRFLQHPVATAEPGSQASRYCQYVVETCTGRSCFTTKEGHIGLGPAVTQAGDHICILLGCRSLMILRPKGSQYEVIGLAYVHGINNGEPLFGQLPVSHKAVLRCDEDGFPKEQVFLNVQNGRIEAKDPRLRKFAQHEMADGLWNSKAPTVDALRARGIALQTFELI